MTSLKVPLYKSLRLRIILGVLIIEIAMLIALFWSYGSIISVTHSDRLKDTASSMLNQVAYTAGRYMVAVDYATLEEYLQTVMQHQELVSIAILDRNKESVITLNKQNISHKTPAKIPHLASVKKSIYYVNKEINVASHDFGHIKMGFTTALMEQAISLARTRGIIIAIIGILLTAFITIILGLRLTKQLTQLSYDAQRVGAGDYNVTTKVSQLDEIGMTATAFNKMVGEISKRNQKLENAERNIKKLYLENRSLVRKSILVQENERKNLSREMHDELGQCITAIQADAETIRDLSQSNNKRVLASAEAILSVSSHIYEVVHAIMLRLRPTLLDDLGLHETLIEEVQAWNQRYPHIHCQLEVELNHHLNEKTNITIYRLVQESLTNIAKHAQAAKIWITLSIDDTSEKKQKEGAAIYMNLVLKIQDNGIGIDKKNLVTGMGIIGMRERVEMLNGQMSLTSNANKGTCINVTIPIKHT